MNTFCSIRHVYKTYINAISIFIFPLPSLLFIIILTTAKFTNDYVQRGVREYEYNNHSNAILTYFFKLRDLSAP